MNKFYAKFFTSFYTSTMRWTRLLEMPAQSAREEDNHWCREKVKSEEYAWKSSVTIFSYLCNMEFMIYILHSVLLGTHYRCLMLSSHFLYISFSNISARYKLKSIKQQRNGKWQPGSRDAIFFCIIRLTSLINYSHHRRENSAHAYKMRFRLGKWRR